MNTVMTYVASLVADDKDIAEAAVDCGVVPAALTALEWSSKSLASWDSTRPNPEKETMMDVDVEPGEEESQAELELREVREPSISILHPSDALNRLPLRSWPRLDSSAQGFQDKSSSETRSQKRQPSPL